MKHSWVVLLVLGGAVGTAPAKAKKDPPLSQLFCHARFVYVETAEGDVLNPNVMNDDRDAAADLQQQLEDWKRYTLVVRRSEADLVFVVRTGRLAEAGVTARTSRDPNPGISGRVGGGPGGADQGPGAGGTPNAGTNSQDPADSAGAGGRNGGVGVGGEIGDPNDTLWVYQGLGDGPALHTWLWRRSESGGLQNPMPLFQQVRRAVDTACVDSDKH
ncbi:MAG TPA: hypothetical protein VHZ25_14285 [Acidobacteriaceae bacterium]|nr:hypothetical protein [Acidobacteriaceae bacterium]